MSKREEKVECFSGLHPLKVKKMHDDATVPRIATPGSVGYDLFCIAPQTINRGEKVTINTYIAVEFQHGIYGQVVPRSSFCRDTNIETEPEIEIIFNNNVKPFIGIIDNDYRGCIHVTLRNHSDHDVEISPKIAIAQLILCPYFQPVVKVVDTLSSTERGEGGFGSTNKK